MTYKISMKHNPAFLDKKDVINNFVVHRKDLKFILEFIRDLHTDSHQHLLIVAPRGWGKTTLVLRTVAEVHNHKDLSDRWYPVVLSEDNYGICTPGEFWLEALNKIREQTGDTYWKKVYESLCTENNEDRLFDDAFHHLVAFSDQQKRHLLLVVENLPVLFDQQISSKAVLKLHHTFLSEPRIKLLATACLPSKPLENSENPIFKLFKMHPLEPLDTNECIDLCKKIATEAFNWSRIRPLQILTGGNPRWLTIMASFFLNDPDHDLMGSLTRVIDERTEYFKNHLENLPPQERKILAAVLAKWQPVTSREIAEVARLNVNLVSAHLQRLLNKGEVVVVSQKGRRKWYETVDRMVPFYNRMRCGEMASNKIRGIVDFMSQFYREENQLDSIELGVEQVEKDHRTALSMDPEDAKAWVNLGNLLSKESNRYPEAENAYQKAIEIEPSVSSHWVHLIKFQFEKRLDENKAFKTTENYLNFFERSPQSLNNIAWLFFERGYKDYLGKAESWCREAVDKDKFRLPYYYHTLASVLCAMDKWDDSLKTSQLFLEDERFVQKEIGEISAFFMNATAKGHAAEAVLILEQYSDITLLEPLIVGLKLYMGLEVLTAFEIREFGQDIANRITEKKSALKPI